MENQILEAYSDINRASSRESNYSIDDKILTAPQTRRAIKMVLQENSVTDPARVDVIYKQIKPKEANGSVRVNVLRQILLLKSKQINFNNSSFTQNTS